MQYAAALTAGSVAGIAGEDTIASAHAPAPHRLTALPRSLLASLTIFPSSRKPRVTFPLVTAPAVPLSCNYFGAGHSPATSRLW